MGRMKSLGYAYAEHLGDGVDVEGYFESIVNGEIEIPKWFVEEWMEANPIFASENETLTGICGWCGKNAQQLREVDYGGGGFICPTCHYSYRKLGYNPHRNPHPFKKKAETFESRGESGPSWPDDYGYDNPNDYEVIMINIGHTIERNGRVQVFGDVVFGLPNNRRSRISSFGTGADKASARQALIDRATEYLIEEEQLHDYMTRNHLEAEGDSWDGTTGDDFRKYDDMELTDKDHEIILEEIERGFENYPADTIRNAKASAVSQINWFGIDKSLGEYDAETFKMENGRKDPYYEVMVDSYSLGGLNYDEFDGLTIVFNDDLSREVLSLDYGEGGDKPLMTPSEAKEDYMNQITITTHYYEPDADDDGEWFGEPNTNIWGGTINFPEGKQREGGEFFARVMGFKESELPFESYRSELEAEKKIMDYIQRTLEVYVRERGEDGNFYTVYDAETFGAEAREPVDKQWVESIRVKKYQPPKKAGGDWRVHGQIFLNRFQDDGKPYSKPMQYTSSVSSWGRGKTKESAKKDMVQRGLFIPTVVNNRIVRYAAEGVYCEAGRHSVASDQIFGYDEDGDEICTACMNQYFGAETKSWRYQKRDASGRFAKGFQETVELSDFMEMNPDELPAVSETYTPEQVVAFINDCINNDDFPEQMMDQVFLDSIQKVTAAADEELLEGLNAAANTALIEQLIYDDKDGIAGAKRAIFVTDVFLNFKWGQENWAAEDF